MKLPIFLALSTLCLLLSSVNCKKPKTVTRTELDKLPPVTQTGANTFGCLINGQAYIPKGSTGPQPNFYVIVDPSFNGDLEISTYRLENGIMQGFSLSCYGVLSTGTFPIPNINGSHIVYAKKVGSNECHFVASSSNYKSGFLKITKYDLQNGNVAGEFEVKLYDATISCDTIRITNGRFDYKL
ncbi:MAG: hypothetical protein JWP69_527 [Flaviaesturariibacter sp.]|nr:hypothetical protein [Flaviaesturariibacter sp.]